MFLTDPFWFKRQARLRITAQAIAAAAAAVSFMRTVRLTLTGQAVAVATNTVKFARALRLASSTTPVSVAGVAMKLAAQRILHVTAGAAAVATSVVDFSLAYTFPVLNAAVSVAASTVNIVGSLAARIATAAVSATMNGVGLKAMLVTKASTQSVAVASSSVGVKASLRLVVSVSTIALMASSVNLNDVPPWTPPAWPTATATTTSAYVTRVSSTAGGTSTYTFTNASIGAANAGRTVVLVVHFLGGSAVSQTPTGVTIGGTAATLVVGSTYASGTQGVPTSIWMLKVPTDTTANIVVQMVNTESDCVVDIYTVTTSDGSNVVATAGAPVYTSTGTTVAAAAMTVPAGGSMIAGASTLGNGTTTWTGVTEKVDAAVSSAGMSSGCIDKATSTSVTAQAVFSVSNRCNLVVAVFAAGSLTVFSGTQAQANAFLTNLAGYYGGAFYNLVPGQNGIFSDAAMTSPIATTGVAVAAVKDMTGAGYDLFQATSADQPTSASDAVTFDGVNDVMVGTKTGMPVLSAVGLFALTSLTNGTLSGFIGVFTNSVDGSTGVDAVWTSSGTGWDTSQGQGSMLAATGDYWIDGANTNVIPVNSTLHTHTAIGNGFTGSATFVNYPQLGADRSNGGRNMQGRVAGVVAVNVLLTDAQRQYTESALRVACGQAA